ncbi:hypothetical protein D5S18_15360 [Nocardia panacis]|uniref:IrrE N-terminal-like domain-containing protein n=1 Tax=Nocardia panacis TaxID=2340916 RepID=A0A3A4JWD0_9NOCA|nr:hypothetical protein [Nocardia panacis]RJO74819.1 hypothetical protein D5S18_15360 [Nocardia panacis]
MTSMEARSGDAARTVPLPNPWDLNAYLAAVAAHRGRPIALRPVPAAVLDETACRVGALWLARGHDDIIVYDDSAGGRATEHVVLHGIGHLLLGHGPAEAHAQGLGSAALDRSASVERLPARLAAALPTISAQSIRHVLGHREFRPDQERDAEVFADMTMVYATLPRRRRRSWWPFGRR